QRYNLFHYMQQLFAKIFTLFLWVLIINALPMDFSQKRRDPDCVGIAPKARITASFTKILRQSGKNLIKS
ncbi:MAG: hypothetical protein J6X10_04215, partial [Bacteroidales bacterium]|nr:hypothetical protein [Bacteroidales bacterium]